MVDVLHQDTLCTISVTLGELVEVGIDVLIDLTGSTVLSKKSTKDSDSSHPKKLGGNTGITSTTSLTETSVVASVLGLLSALDTRAGVNGLRLADDETVLNQFADILTRVSQSNFSNFVGIHPDLALTTLKDGSSESLLKLK